MAIGSSQWMYATDTTFSIPYSCRFDNARTTHMERTMGTPTNTDKWVFSCWVKISQTNNSESMSMLNAGLDGSGAGEGDINFNASEELYMYSYEGGYKARYISDAKFRDPNAWMNIVVANDTTQATASNRVLMYVNGTLVTDFSTETDPAQDYSSDSFNTACEHRIGNERADNRELDGYLAEMHFIDGMSFFSDTSGTANTSFNIGTFGETGDYGEWKPIKVSGVTYGNNGIYLDFADSSALGNDVSGNNNDFTVSNLTAADQMLDSPTNNFATINPLSFYWPYPLTMSEGNLKSYYGAAFSAGFATSFVSSGKWYVECLITRKASPFIGVWDEEFGFDSGDQQNSTHKVCYISDGRKSIGTTFSSYGATYAVGDIIAIKLDQDNNTITFYKNNSSQGEISLSGTVVGTLDLIIGGAGRNDTMIWNFGQDSSFAGEKTAQGNQDSNDIGDFYYTPPSNHLALCSANMPAVAVSPNEHFDTVQYSGSSSTVTVNDVGFQPDLGWFKKNSAAENSAIVDSSRGVGTRFCSNTNEAEESGGITSFDSDGFTCSGGSGRFTENGHTYSAWFWKANAGTTAAENAGNINATIQANQDAGFSIATYTGVGGDNKTIEHGLSQAPEFILIKRREQGNWVYWSHRLADNYAYEAITSNAAVSGGNPSKYVDSVTSTLVELGDAGENNADNGTYAMYCWHGVEGYSKFGLYTGNGNVNGTFVYCGFKPRMVWIKGVFGEHGTMHDTVLNPHNVAIYDLLPGYSGGKESGTSEYIDIVSNGFKIRTSDYRHNKDGGDYIFMAWAEEPFKYATAR